MQNTNFKIEMTKVNLYDILQDVYHSGARLAQDKNINITFVTDNKLYPLMGDYGRIRQMFMVFVDNSIKFSPAGSQVEVTMSGRTVKVTDHGCGVPDHELAHIFDSLRPEMREKQVQGGTFHCQRNCGKAPYGGSHGKQTGSSDKCSGEFAGTFGCRCSVLSRKKRWKSDK